jgi:hypothetical protein
MSEIWEYNSESNNSISRIYLTSITSNNYGKKFGWTVVFNDGLKCNLDDEMINNYNLTDLDKIALNEAKENSNKLKIQDNYLIRLMRRFKNYFESDNHKNA